MSAINRIKELNEKRGAKLKEASAIVNKAREEKRELTADESQKLTGYHSEVDNIDSTLAAELRQAKLEGEKAPVYSSGEQRDLDGFSLSKFLNQLADGGARSLDGIEAEMAQEGGREARDCGVSSKGVMLSAKVLRRSHLRLVAERRDMTATGTTSTTLDQGGMTIATEKLGLLDHLFNRSVLVQAGATVLNNLQGNIDLPRLVAGTVAAKKAENAQGDEYTATTAKLSLSPKRLPTVMEVSNQLLRQSSVAIDGYLTNHLERMLRQVMDVALIHGGGTNEPTGILGTTGIGAIYAGAAAADNTNADGSGLVWADIVNLEKEVAIDNADIGSLGYLTNATQVGKAKKTVRVSSTDSMFILDDRFGRQLNGYNYFVSNSVSSALTKGSGTGLSAWIFGNFADLVIAQWGGIEFLVNPYTKDDYGLTRINAAVYYDGGVVRPVSFAAGDDFTA